MSVDYRPSLRTDLAGVHPYGAPHIDVPVRLNVNENPFPPPDAVVNAIAVAVRTCAQGLNRYPDREAVELRECLSQYLDEESQVRVDPTRIWPANGSNEVMLHLFQAYGGPGRTALTFDPTYSMYAEYARTTCTEFLSAPRSPDFTVDVDLASSVIAESTPSLVLVASPNNPTGTTTPLAQIETLAESALESGAILVVDEAYAEFRRPGTPSALEVLARYPNVVVTRTLSKAFGLAGARIGYAVGDESLIDGLRLVRLPYHLSAVSQAVASAALRHRAELRNQVELLRQERDALFTWLHDRGWRVLPSDANFLAFGAFADRDAAWQDMVNAGVLVRATGPEGFLRVSVGTPAENARFREVLDALASPRC